MTLHSKTGKFCTLLVSLTIMAGILGVQAAHAQVYILDPQTGVLVPQQTQTQSQYRITTQNQSQLYAIQVQQLQQLLNQIQQLIALLNARGGTYVPPSTSGSSEIDVTTRSATNIEDDRARLHGEVDFNSSDYAYLWFEWGEDDDDLDEETPRIRRDDDEDEDFSATITRLEEDQRYYFRAIGRDDRGRTDRGSIRSFTTDDDGRRSSSDDIPDVTTNSARNITDDSVELRGEVDMNDFDDGIVFVVYGEDEDQVEDVEDDFDSYSDVDEDGDDLRKERIDSGLDGRRSYTVDINGLDDNTEYFFNFCVEYEDEDDDETLECGSVRSFETD